MAEVKDIFDTLVTETVQGVKVYYDVTPALQQKYINNAEEISRHISQRMFTNLKFDTNAVTVSIANLAFEEKDLMARCKANPPNLPIKIIKSEDDVVVANGYTLPPPKKKNNRGRKSKKDPNKKKKTFASQVTFVVGSDNVNKDFKVKVFKKSSMQIPGSLCTNFQDIVPVAKTIVTYLREILQLDLRIKYITPNMQNFSMCLRFKNNYVILTELERILNMEKYSVQYSAYIDYCMKFLPENSALQCRKFINKTNYMNIAEISYNPDQCTSLSAKFNRPSPRKPNSKITIGVVAADAKIRILNCSCIEAASEIYEYFVYLFDTYRANLLVTSDILDEPSSPISDSDLESIYSD